MMSRSIAGAILLSTSGIVAAIGAIGAQIAAAIVKGQFYARQMGGVIPPGPDEASLPWPVAVAAVGLAVVGVMLLFRPTRDG